MFSKTIRGVFFKFEVKVSDFVRRGIEFGMANGDDDAGNNAGRCSFVVGSSADLWRSNRGNLVGVLTPSSKISTRSRFRRLADLVNCSGESSSMIVCWIWLWL